MSDNIKQTIGKRIHRLRRSHDLTQQGLAQRIGVNASYIGPLEKGLKCPSIAVLEKIAEVFDQPMFSFFVDELPEFSADTNIQRLAALLSSHPDDERRFLLRMLEDAAGLLASRRRPVQSAHR